MIRLVCDTLLIAALLRPSRPRQRGPRTLITVLRFTNPATLATRWLRSRALAQYVVLSLGALPCVFAAPVSTQNRLLEHLSSIMN
jgi:hypothetical protein